MLTQGVSVIVLTQIQSSESKVGNREKNMDVCEEREMVGLEF